MLGIDLSISRRRMSRPVDLLSKCGNVRVEQKGDCS